MKGKLASKLVFAGRCLFMMGVCLCTLFAIRHSSKDIQDLLEKCNYLCMNETTTEWKFVKTINLGIENPGTQIAEFERVTNLVPNPAVICVITSKGRFFPDTLQQFHGLVHISNAREALRFVRLRTSRNYCYNWSGNNVVQEIVSFSQSTASEFADTGGAYETGLVHSPMSGRYGLLSDLAYREGKFQPSTAKAVVGGYRITRWVCIYTQLEGSAVQKWQEEVKPDGEYHCTVLKSISPPKLPDTEWYIYGLS